MKLKEYQLPNGRKLEIHSHDEPESPREWDNVGVMACWHRRNNFGDEQISMEDFNTAAEVKEHLEAENDIAVILPLYLYDHGGMTMATTPFSCPWDSGQVGWIYATTEQVNTEWDGDVKKAETYLRGEVETYDQWLRGDVYGFIIREAPCDSCGGEGDTGDSCWGFYGDDPKENGMMDHLDKEDCEALKTAEAIPA